MSSEVEEDELTFEELQKISGEQLQNITPKNITKLIIQKRVSTI